MKRKLIKRNKTWLGICRNIARETGLGDISTVLYYHRENQDAYQEYKYMKKEAYSKAGRVAGLYEVFTGKSLTKLCVGKSARINNIIDEYNLWGIL